MKKIKNLDILVNYIFLKMPEATDREFRLTTYILSILVFTKQSHCWIYFNELIEGRDKFIGNGKRERVLNGLGLNKRELIHAIKEVNNRGLISIEAPDNSGYLLKITLNSKEK